MTDKYSIAHLQGVPETLTIPLYMRARETERPDAIIRDEKALEMVARIDYDFTRFKDTLPSQTGIAIRTEILDEGVNEFLSRHPRCVILNIAAGLDTRYLRLGLDQRESIRWYDLDLPETIALRRQFFNETARHHFIAASALDTAWMATIERGEPPAPVLCIIEGLLMYFTEDQVKALLRALAEHFPGGEALLEVIGVSQAANTHLSDAVSKTNAAFQWGIRHTAEIGTWDARLRCVGDTSIYDRHAERWTGIEDRAPLPNLRNTVNRIVHLQFAG